MSTTTADSGSAGVADQPAARQLRRPGDDMMLAGVALGRARYQQGPPPGSRARAPSNAGCNTMDGTGGGRLASAASRWAATGTVAAYAAAIVAFAYALVSLYWAAGGQALIGTVGGYVQQLAGRGGAAPLLAALVAGLAARPSSPAAG